MNGKIISKKAKPAPNRTVNAAPLKRLGLRSARSVATLAPTPHSSTFLQPWSLLRKALIRAAKTSFTADTLCESFAKCCNDLIKEFINQYHGLGIHYGILSIYNRQQGLFVRPNNMALTLIP